MRFRKSRFTTSGMALQRCKVRNIHMFRQEEKSAGSATVGVEYTGTKLGELRIPLFACMYFLIV